MTGAVLSQQRRAAQVKRGTRSSRREYVSEVRRHCDSVIDVCGLVRNLAGSARDAHGDPHTPDVMGTSDNRRTRNPLISRVLPGLFDKRGGAPRNFASVRVPFWGSSFHFPPLRSDNHQHPATCKLGPFYGHFLHFQCARMGIRKVETWGGNLGL